MDPGFLSWFRFLEASVCEDVLGVAASVWSVDGRVGLRSRSRGFGFSLGLEAHGMVLKMMLSKLHWVVVLRNDGAYQ